MNSVRNLGNYIASMHDKANRDTIHFAVTNMRRCEVGKHSAPRLGMVKIGRLSCCAACRGKFQ